MFYTYIFYTENLIKKFIQADPRYFYLEEVYMNIIFFKKKQKQIYSLNIGHYHLYFEVMSAYQHSFVAKLGKKYIWKNIEELKCNNE